MKRRIILNFAFVIAVAFMLFSPSKAKADDCCTDYFNAMYGVVIPAYDACLGDCSQYSGDDHTACVNSCNATYYTNWSYEIYLYSGCCQYAHM